MPVGRDDSQRHTAHSSRRFAYRRRTNPRGDRGRSRPWDRRSAIALWSSCASGSTISARPWSASRAVATPWSEHCSANPSIRAASAACCFSTTSAIWACACHGTIGLVATLAHLGRIGAGEHRIETPVGVVSAAIGDDRRVTVRNVESFRTQERRPRRGEWLWPGDRRRGLGRKLVLSGSRHAGEICLSNVERLTDVTWRIRQALTERGITGTDSAEIDHIELFGPPTDAARRQQEFRALSGQSLRSLSVRHRHQRQTGLPGRRRQIAPARRGGKRASSAAFLRGSSAASHFWAFSIRSCVSTRRSAWQRGTCPRR